MGETCGLIAKALEVFELKDGQLYWKKPRIGIKVGSPAGHKRADGYYMTSIDGKLVYVHRVIYGMVHGHIPKVIDHINGNPSDNRIENLRAATTSQNTFNAGLRSTNKSGVKGVCWHKQSNKWRAQIYLNGKQKFLGTFDDLHLAEQAAIEARNQYHGEFARHE